MSPDFATLYSFNANASISRELPKGFVVSGSYLYTKGTHLPVYRNINLVPSGAYLADGRPIFSASARVYQGFNNILSGRIRRQLELQRPEHDPSEALRQSVPTVCDVHMVARDRRCAGAEQYRQFKFPFGSDKPAERPRQFSDGQAPSVQHDRRVPAGISSIHTVSRATSSMATSFR